MTRRWTWAAPCALLLWLAAAPAADAYLYWANKYENQIGRARLDGSAVDQGFVTVASSGASHPVGVAVDSGHLYWANFEDDDTIGRANLDGTGVDQQFVTGASDPVGVALDAGHVYWTNRGTGTIGRAGLDGSQPKQDFIGGVTEPYGLAVDGAHVYWSDKTTGAIGRADLDGSDPDPTFITGAAAPTAVAVDATHLYWTNSSSATIARADLDGTDPDQDFITGAVDPWGLAVDGAHVYWTNQGPPKTIGRADIDGSDADQSFVDAAPTGVYGVAVGPLVTTITGGPSGTVGSPLATFTFRSSEPGSFRCWIDNRPAAPCASPMSYAGLRNGSHTFRVRAWDAAGNYDPSPATRGWRVNVFTGSTGPPADTHAPDLSRLSLSRSRLAAGLGTQVRYALSEDAKVRFSVRRRRAGRVVRGRCRKRTRANRGRRSCNLLLKGSFSRRGRAGINRTRFSGRLRGRKLKPGRYLLVARATDNAGNRSAEHSVGFRIRKR